MVGKTRDRIVVESEKVGQPAREGDILEVIVAPYGTHYRVLWDDGHESTSGPPPGAPGSSPPRSGARSSRRALPVGLWPVRQGVESGFSTFRPPRRLFRGQLDRLDRPLVDKSLVRVASNVHSKSCPKGPTFTVEPAWGAIPGAVPGDRTDDRKAAGHGPGGGSTIASNRDGRSAVGRQPVPPGALLSGPGGRRLFGYRADDGPVTYPTTPDPLGSGIVATSRVAAGICSNEISRAGKRDRGRR